MFEVITSESAVPSTVEEKDAAIAAMSGEIVQLKDMLRTMADMIRVNNEQIARMEKTMQALAMKQPVTRAQAAGLNRLLKERAELLAGEWECQGKAGDIARCIRHDVKQALLDGAGVSIRSMGDVPSCQYKTVCGIIGRWDNMIIKRKIRKGEKV